MLFHSNIFVSLRGMGLNNHLCFHTVNVTVAVLSVTT